jgi:hypothetical protein
MTLNPFTVIPITPSTANAPQQVFTLYCDYLTNKMMVNLVRLMRDWTGGPTRVTLVA